MTKTHRMISFAGNNDSTSPVINLRDDLGRDICSTVFSPSQNSEFRTITLPPQQARTQRMRSKIRSNPKEGEGGQ